MSLLFVEDKTPRLRTKRPSFAYIKAVKGAGTLSYAIRIFCIWTLLIALFLIVTFGQTSNSFLIHDVPVFDGERVLEHRSVVVKDGKIAQITKAKPNLPGADVIEGQGRTLLPGLFDAHVHMGRM